MDSRSRLFLLVLKREEEQGEEKKFGLRKRSFLGGRTSETLNWPPRRGKKVFRH